jgi:hypothetical protein
MLESIDNNYYKKPMICFVTAEQEGKIVEFLENKEWQYYIDSSHD